MPWALLLVPVTAALLIHRPLERLVQHCSAPTLTRAVRRLSRLLVFRAWLGLGAVIGLALPLMVVRLSPTPVTFAAMGGVVELLLWQVHLEWTLAERYDERAHPLVGLVYSALRVLHLAWAAWALRERAAVRPLLGVSLTFWTVNLVGLAVLILHHRDSSGVPQARTA